MEASIKNVYSSSTWMSFSTLNSGGGTNMYPGMSAGYQALSGVRAKIKHMIVLTDGNTSGSGYEALAAQCRAEGITISTVAVGGGASSPNAARTMLHAITSLTQGYTRHAWVESTHQARCAEISTEISALTGNPKNKNRLNESAKPSDSHSPAATTLADAPMMDPLPLVRLLLPGPNSIIKS